MVSKSGNSGEAPSQAEWVNALSQAPAFTLWPQLVTESMRFWAKRLHAYADWMTTMARSTTPAHMMEAQSQFVAHTQADYVSESARLATLARNGNAGGVVEG